MRENQNNSNRTVWEEQSAKNWASSGGFQLRPARKTAVEGDWDNDVPTLSEALRPFCSTPSQEFQPLNDYQREKLLGRTMEHLRRLQRERNVALDLDYWGRCTRTILGQRSPAETIIIPAPAGSGKSTWIEAYAMSVVELLREEPELLAGLVGITLVLQKVADLNRIAKVLNEGAEEDCPNMAVIQAWSKSGQELGFCRNRDVKSFEECQPTHCPYAGQCKILAFREQALFAPMVGMTQERFLMLRSSGQLGLALYRVGEDGRPYPRHHLFFDEKFQMAQIDLLNKNTIDEASKESTRLVQKQAASDQQVRCFQQRLEYQVNRPFQQLRSKLRTEVNWELRDILAGACDMKDAELDQRLDYGNFRNSVLEGSKKFATENMRAALAVMDKLYAGEPCLFSKSSGFTVANIHPPVVRYGQCQTLIFDATAKVDEDYTNLPQVQWIHKMPKRKTCDVALNIYTHADLGVSKQAMKASWKIPVFCRFIAELIAAKKSDAFICTYKEHAEALADALEAELPPEDFGHVLLMEGKDRPTLPYLGGTNGSNSFHKAKTVVMLGYPRLNPQDYLIHAAAAYGPERMISALQQVPPEDLTTTDLNVLYAIPEMRTYIAHHLAARLEQEIFRCAIRDPDFEGEIDVYLFCPPPDALKILQDRLPERITCIYHGDLPQYAALYKSSARKYGNGPTSLARLELFIKSWDGHPIRSAELREKAGISSDAWKELTKDERFDFLLQEYGVKRQGRGRNCTYCIAGAGDT